MIIIVEGVDGSGKTTLVKTLSEDYGYNVLTEQPKRGSNNMYDNWRELIDCASDCIYIADRSFITEIVYRQVDGEPCDYSFVDFAKLVTRGGIKIVHCTDYFAWKNAQERGEDNVIDEKVHRTITEKYAQLFDLLKTIGHVPIITITPRQGITKELLKFINSN